MRGAEGRRRRGGDARRGGGEEVIQSAFEWSRAGLGRDSVGI